MNPANIVVSVVVALASSGGLWATLQAVINRSGKRAEAAAQVLEAEERRRSVWMQEAQAAYRRLEGECERCRDALAALRGATADLVDLVDEIIPVLPMSDERVDQLRHVLRTVKLAL